MEAHEATAYSLKLAIVEKLSTTYDSLARQSEDEFAKGLRLGKLFKRAIPFLRDKDTRTWLQDLKARFERSARKQIQSEAAGVSKDLFDEMRTMMDELAQGIAGRQERLRENALLPHAAAHSAMLEQLRSKLEFIRVDDEVLRGKVAETKDVRTLALAGSGLAGLGIIIAALSPILWLDITGEYFWLPASFWSQSDCSGADQVSCAISGRSWAILVRSFMTAWTPNSAKSLTASSMRCVRL